MPRSPLHHPNFTRAIGSGSSALRSIASNSRICCNRDTTPSESTDTCSEGARQPGPPGRFARWPRPHGQVIPSQGLDAAGALSASVVRRTPLFVDTALVGSRLRQALSSGRQPASSSGSERITAHSAARTSFTRRSSERIAPGSPTLVGARLGDRLPATARRARRPLPGSPVAFWAATPPTVGQQAEGGPASAICGDREPNDQTTARSSRSPKPGARPASTPERSVSRLFIAFITINAATRAPASRRLDRRHHQLYASHHPYRRTQ